MFKTFLKENNLFGYLKLQLLGHFTDKDLLHLMKRKNF